MQKIGFQFSHGGYIRQETAKKTLLGIASREINVETDSNGETDFNYLFPELAKDPNSLLSADDADTIDKLKKLGEAMVDIEPPEDPEETNSIIPPVYTYWGQFIDHDITANTDRTAEGLETDITKDNFKPLSPDLVTDKLKNLRRPTFDLDSVYGDGPTLDPESPTEAKDFYQEDDPVKLKVGQNTPFNKPNIPPEDDLTRDLPRNNRIAVIGDSRNDENLIVAQFHTAFLRFHNAVVDWVRDNEPETAKNQRELFVRAQNLVRWHYQWLVVNDFLKTLTVNGTVDSILKDGLKFYEPRNGELFMPLEFSVASYRFGHSMVRSAYDYNRNFPDATFDFLFAFTGRGNISGFETVPSNWIIEWDRFVNKDRAAERKRNSARKIDTHLAPPLKQMSNEGNGQPDPIRNLLKHLAQRNLLRGYLLSIPTGQSLAKQLGILELTSDELSQGNSDAMNQALEPFLTKTPAWYYILKESEVRANGDSLGEVGSRIVAETFMGLMMNDPFSYLNQHESDDSPWNPSRGVKLPDGGEIRVIGDFLKFAKVLL